MCKIYCSNCKKHTIHKPKLDEIIYNKSVCNICSKLNSNNILYKVDDKNFYKESNDVSFILWNEDGSYKDILTTPVIGSSLVMDLHFEPILNIGYNYTWLTTQIIDIITLEPGHIKFKTINNGYNLYVPIVKN